MKKYKIGITFGVFDLFHIGHLNLLRRAKQQCDYLIVCISTNEYSKKHKNKIPVISFIDRASIVSAIKYVDKVDKQDITFSKKDAIKKYNPSVIFVGNDWTTQNFSGMNLGIPVVFLPYTKSISSSKLREKIHVK